MPPAPTSRFQTEAIGGVTVILFRDAEIVDDYTLNAVRDELYKFAEAKKARYVLNLSKVKKFSTMLIATMLGFKRRLEKAGGQMKICCIAPHLREAVTILQLDREFDIHPEEQAAVDAF